MAAKITRTYPVLSERKQYVAIQEISGIKVGDIVKVIGCSPSYHLGWPLSWEEGMDTCYGQEYHVTEVTESGIKLNTTVGWIFPVYCLEKVANAYVSPKFILSNEYTAEVLRDGTVRVGCQNIPASLMDKIMVAVNAAPDRNTKSAGYIPVRYSKETLEKLTKTLNDYPEYYMLDKNVEILNGDLCYHRNGIFKPTRMVGELIGNTVASDNVYIRMKI